MTRSFGFKPGLSLTVATVLTLGLLLALGTWQMQRLAWKTELIEARQTALAAPPTPLPSKADDWSRYDFRRVSVTGRFLHDRLQWYGVSTHVGKLGHQLLTPLVRDDGSLLLIDRGWVPANQRSAWIDRRHGPSSPVTVTGIARFRLEDRSGWFTPANQPENRQWFTYDLPALEQSLGMALLPVVIEADNKNDGSAKTGESDPPIGGRTRTALPNNHLQYALTWYGLAAALLAVYISLGRAGAARAGTCREQPSR